MTKVIDGNMNDEKIINNVIKMALTWDQWSKQRQLEYLQQHPGSKKHVTSEQRKMQLQLQITEVVDNLRKLPFIDTVKIDKNFYDEPTIHATSTPAPKGKKTLDTQLAISFSPKDHSVKFESISVRNDELGRVIQRK